LVDLEALLHQRAQAVGRKLVGAIRNIERRKPEIGQVAKPAGAEEAAGLQVAQPTLVARLEEERAIKLVRLFGDLFACSLAGRMLREIGQKFGGKLRADTSAAKAQCRARPVGEALLQQGEIKQPFTR